MTEHYTMPFFRYMRERYAITQRRKAGQPWPWTDEPILREWRFCNVHREDDSVTKWLRERWREPYAKHPNLWLAMCIARQINWPLTLEAIGFPHTFDDRYIDDAIATMQDMKADGKKVYTGAYMLRGDSSGGDKPHYTMRRVIAPLLKSPLPRLMELSDGGRPVNIQEVTELLRDQWGWGEFLGYEVATDLRHTRYLRHARDTNLWAHAGPGAMRGLNRVAGRPYAGPLYQHNALQEMRKLLEWGAVFVKGIPLELRDIEHTLCEFDKYERVRLGQGKPRSRYTPPGWSTHYVRD